MSKNDFLMQLRKGLSGLPQEDVEERLTFYGEMIDDRMEEGIDEEDAVREIGTVDRIVAQSVADIPLSKLVKEKMISKKKLKGWEIFLIVLGSPLWIPLLITAFSVAVVFFVVCWVVIISFWCVFISLTACILGGIASGIFYICNSGIFAGIAMIGLGVFSAGLTVFVFLGCKLLTKGIIAGTRKLVICVKNRIIGKERE